MVRIMARKCGTITLLQVALMFVIVLAALIMTGGSIGKKLINATKGIDVPIHGTECPGNVGEVTIDEFRENLAMATKVAWNGQKRCWIKQKLDAGTITQKEMHEIMKVAMDVWNEKEYDDCMSGYFSPDSTTSVTDIDMVVWWDNKAVCRIDGLLDSLWSWVQGVKGMSRDTLHFYEREDYCKADGSEINWYNPPGGSNVLKYSESKTNYNDDRVCRDESSSGGLNHRLPDTEDWTGKSVADIKNDLTSKLSNCVTEYKNKYNDGDTGGADIYLACREKYKIKITTAALITAIVSDGETYGGDAFSYTSNACDIRDDGDTTIPDYGEFSSGTWIRSSVTDHCIYIVRDGFVQTANDLVNVALDDDTEYIITPFFYFEDGANDIIIDIDTRA